MLSRQPIPDNVIVELCDADEKWGPFLFLRPPKDRPLTLLRSASMAVVAGLGFGMLGNILLALTARLCRVPALSGFAFPLSLSLLYFCACSWLVAPAWNRRVERLARLGR